VIGILNRWRQFGRRYFWPHLLLGMVAASFGVSSGLGGSSDQSSLPNPSSTLNRQNSASTAFTRLMLLQEAHRRPAFSVDYWHQHAIRTVIRHLSFALAPAAVYQAATDAEAIQAVPLQAQRLALLVTLNALLTHEPKPPTIIRSTSGRLFMAMTRYHAGLWLAQVQGIRAGPIA